ncbi:MAG: AmmeMemoRadiSam system protein A [Nanoarchaeota archaeon]
MVAMYSTSEKKFLINLAKRAIENYFEKREILEVNKPKYEKLNKEKGTFVTLYKKEELRGCIGNIIPQEPIYKSVIKNAVNSAFNDPRFPQLTKDELKDIKIEISILTVPKKMNFKSKDELLKKLTRKDGVILKGNDKSATFLPQVWSHFQNKVDFLGNLCMKAYLPINAWEDLRTEIYIYKVDVIK